MPADGISLPPKRDFGTSRWGGSKVRLHQRRHRMEGVMTANGTKPTSRHVCSDVRLQRVERKSCARAEPFPVMTQLRHGRLKTFAPQKHCSFFSLKRDIVPSVAWT
jgi:3-phenylpropionate/cinnamic acid dioxygenase small subunit